MAKKANTKIRKELPECGAEEMLASEELIVTNSKAKTPINTCRYVISLLGRKGFFGIEPIVQLMLNDCKNVPDEKGIFFILTTDTEMPCFLTLEQQLTRYLVNKSIEKKQGDAHKRWIEGSYILYIGAVGGNGKNKGRVLKQRIKKFIKFGMGKSEDKCGGSYVWLLRCLCPILVCWIPMPEECNPHDVKKRLLQEFVRFYGKLPYANLR